MTLSTKIPPNWGKDSISHFIEDTQQNTFATFHNLKPLYNLLLSVNEIFVTMVNNMNRTDAWFATLFFHRAHASYLGAVRFCLSGQIVEAYMILRGCLEFSLYGLYLHNNKKSCVTWLKRHKQTRCNSKKNATPCFTIYDIRTNTKEQQGRKWWVIKLFRN